MSSLGRSLFETGGSRPARPVLSALVAPARILASSELTARAARCSRLSPLTASQANGAAWGAVIPSRESAILPPMLRASLAPTVPNRSSIWRSHSAGIGREADSVSSTAVGSLITSA